MKTTKSILSIIAAGALALSAAADTIAWWHFDECDPGTTAPANTVASDQAPTKFATPYSFAGSTATANSGDYLPVYTRPFAGRAVYDPVSDTTRTNCAAMRFTTGNTSGNAGRAYYGGALSVPTRDIYSSLYGTTNLTVEAFVCTTGGVYNLFAPIVGSVGGTSWTNERFALYMQEDGTLALRFAAGSSSADVWYSGNGGSGKTKVNDGVWHHVAFTYDGSYVRIYVDYVLDKKSNGADRVYGKTGTIPTYSTDNTTWIGGYNTYDSSNGGRRFPGLIDEVRVSNATLQPSQFLRLRPTEEKAASDTLLHLDFDGNGTLQYCESLNDDFGLQASYLPGADLATFDAVVKAGAVVADGLYADASAANASSFQHTNATLSAGVVSAPKIGAALMPSGSSAAYVPVDFTVEGFFKTSGESAGRQNVFKIVNIAPNSNSTVAQFITGDDTHSHEADFCFNTVGTWKNIHYSKAPIDDGEWHHAALVYDAANYRMSAYVDYNLVSRSANITNRNYTTAQLFVGRSEGTRGQDFNGWIDDVRVTKRALAPQEFLTTHPVGSGTQPLLTALLEQDYSFVCATDNYWSVTGVGEARTNGVAPVFQRVSRGPLFLDGTNGAARAENEYSARMEKSRIVFPTSPLYEQDAYAVEFWAKFDGISDTGGAVAADATLSQHAGILRFVRENTTTFDWYLYRMNTNGKVLQVAVRNASNKTEYMGGSTWSLPNVVADGRWHHYALAFNPNADNTSVEIELFYDYESLGKETAAGIYKGAASHRLLVCESTQEHANLIGNIDAIRFWRGIPAPSQFLGRAPNAFSIIVR